MAAYATVDRSEVAERSNHIRHVRSPVVVDLHDASQSSVCSPPSITELLVDSLETHLWLWTMASLPSELRSASETWRLLSRHKHAADELQCCDLIHCDPHRPATLIIKINEMVISMIFTTRRPSVWLWDDSSLAFDVARRRFVPQRGRGAVGWLHVICYWSVVLSRYVTINYEEHCIQI